MSKATSTRVFVENVDGVTVASFADNELTADHLIEEVSDQLHGLAETLNLSKVVLNFGEVRLMSSSMLAVLLKFTRKVKDARGEVRLCSIAPNLMEVFKICKFDRIFKIFAHESEAIDSF